MAAEPILDVRTCAGCDARLSRYNPDDVCAPCGRASRDRVLSSPGQPRAASSGPVAAAFLEYRRRHGLSQMQLAALLGLDQSYVSKVENGVRQIRDLDTLRLIAERLDLPPERLGLAPAAPAPGLTITIAITDLTMIEHAGDAVLELLARLSTLPSPSTVTSRAS